MARTAASVPSALHSGNASSLGEALPPAIRQDAGCLLVERERTLGVKERGAVEQFDQRLGALLQPRHGGEKLFTQRWIERRSETARRAVLGQDRLQGRDEPLVRGLAQIVAVEVFELGEVEARRRASNAAQVERCDHLIGGEDFLVAVAPAEADEVVA